MPPPSTRPYRDFLMPALHRRFTRACLYTFPVCYIIAVWMGNWESFLWTWLPIGFVGIRTMFLCIPALLVYLLRITQWHTGRRNTQSPLSTLRQCILTRRLTGTLFIYALSAFLYCEVYIWAQAKDNVLEVTRPVKLHERTKLNERPIYLRFLFMTLAIVQSILHLYSDYDWVEIPLQNGQTAATPEAQLLRKLLKMASTVGLTACAACALGTLVYHAAFRRQIWALWYSFMKQLVNIAKTSTPTGLTPSASLACTFLAEGTLLLFLWQFSNTAFTVLMAKEPLKNNKPITSDSKDPNGSLLNGLKSKKEDNKNTAFWELALITERFDDRRKTIYGELERKKGSTSKQITDVCLAQINELVNRTKSAQDPKFRPEDIDKQVKKQDSSVQLVPRIAAPLQEKNVTGPPPKPETRLQRIEATAAEIARAHSSPENAQGYKGRQALRKGQEVATQGVTGAVSAWERYKNIGAQTPIGWIWRSSVRREAKSVVFDTPYSRKIILYHAITILANLTVASIKEDDHGTFQNEVPNIVRAFTKAINAVESYTQGLEVHATDAEALALPEADRTKVPEVEELKTALKEGLEKMLGAFNEYLSTMGMTRAEIQAAKECIAQPQPEMQQRRIR